MIVIAVVVVVRPLVEAALAVVGKPWKKKKRGGSVVAILVFAPPPPPGADLGQANDIDDHAEVDTFDEGREGGEGTTTPRTMMTGRRTAPIGRDAVLQLEF